MERRKAAVPVTSTDMRRFPFSDWSWQRVELSHFSTVAKSELFVTDSESDPTQSQQMPGAFKPPAPQAPVRYACLQDPSEA